MKNEFQTTYAAWTQAVADRHSFYVANQQSWNAEVNATYNELADRAESLWLTLQSLRTGLSTDQVAAAINDRIHSPRD